MSEPTYGFLISLVSTEYSGESLARRIAAAISDTLPGLDEVEVIFMGTIDEYPESN